MKALILGTGDGVVAWYLLTRDYAHKAHKQFPPVCVILPLLEQKKAQGRVKKFQLEENVCTWLCLMAHQPRANIIPGETEP